MSKSLELLKTPPSEEVHFQKLETEFSEKGYEIPSESNTIKEEPKPPRVFMIKPKRPISSFFMYKSERYKEIVAVNPQLKIAEITKKISEEWAIVVD